LHRAILTAYLWQRPSAVSACGRTSGTAAAICRCCTALAEHPDGRFEIIAWSDHPELLPPPVDEDESLSPFEQRTGIAA